jgi:hypothetical protein
MEENPENYFERVVAFQSTGFEQTRILAGEIIEPDEDEGKYLEECFERLMILNAGGPPTPSSFDVNDFRFANAAVRKHTCRLCKIAYPDATRPRRGFNHAYVQMVLYDLMYCGVQSELHVFEGAKATFNYAQEVAIRKNLPGFFITTSEVREHLTKHDKSNIKRPIVQQIYRIGEIIEGCLHHVNGVTGDGRRVFNGKNADRVNKYGQQLIQLHWMLTQASAYINVTVFNQSNDAMRSRFVNSSLRRFGSSHSVAISGPTAPFSTASGR